MVTQGGFGELATRQQDKRPITIQLRGEVRLEVGGSPRGRTAAGPARARAARLPRPEPAPSGHPRRADGRAVARRGAARPRRHAQHAPLRHPARARRRAAAGPFRAPARAAARRDRGRGGGGQRRSRDAARGTAGRPGAGLHRCADRARHLREPTRAALRRALARGAPARAGGGPADGPRACSRRPRSPSATTAPLRAQLAARQLVELAPFRESGHALLMRAHAARGNHAEALQAFERLRVLLRDELGSTPSPALRALHEQVLAAADRRTPRCPAPWRASPSRGRGCRPGCSGRRSARSSGGNSALGALRRELTAARAASAASCCSRVSPASARRALAPPSRGRRTRAGAIVLYGRADEEALVPYQPFVDVISHLVLSGQLDGLGDEPPLRARGARAPRARAAPAAPGQQRARRRPTGDRAVPALRGRDDDAGRGWPGSARWFLLFDDLHWADRPTLLLLRHLARATEPQQLLVVGDLPRRRGGARPPPLADMIGDVRRELPLEADRD